MALTQAETRQLLNVVKALDGITSRVSQNNENRMHPGDLDSLRQIRDVIQTLTVMKGAYPR